MSCLIFFFNDTATTEIYTLSLHDALPISDQHPRVPAGVAPDAVLRPQHDRLRRHARLLPAASAVDRPVGLPGVRPARDRKSTRLNSSHANISYAVFCLKKKKITNQYHTPD